MATLRPRPDMGGKYELDYTDVDGRRYRIDTGTDDPKIARVWLQKVQKQLSLAKLGEIPKVGPLTREMVAGKARPEQQKRLHLAAFEQEYLERCKTERYLAEGTLALNKFQ